MWNLPSRGGHASNPLKALSAGESVVYQTPEPCPRFGWVVALQTEQSSSQLTGSLKASFSGAGTVQKTIAETFNLADEDVFFIPYPSIELTVSNSDDGAASIVVNFYPVDDQETGVLFRGVLHYMSTHQADKETSTTISIPSGVTDWCGLTNVGDTLQIALQDPGGNPWFGYTYGSGTAINNGTLSGAQFFPCFTGSTIKATNGTGEHIRFTLLWKYNFQRPGGA
jgi:hypothetical protein